MKATILWIFTVTIIFIACKGEVYNNQSILNSPQNQTQEKQRVAVPDQNTERAIWQKPSLVIDRLGDLSYATVADIGAGAGYFSFRLANKAQKVLAIDIEKSALRYIDSLKTTLPNNIGKKVESRLATPDDPKLADQEVDVIVIINTIAYIKDLPAYLQKLKKSLRPNGRIMVIDYKMKRLPINAPPKTERVYLDKIEDMLVDAGFKLETSDDTTLDYQYIVVGSL